MDRKEWLNGLKPRDEVAVTNRYGVAIDMVTRTTKTQIVVGNWKFRKLGGDRVGSSYWDTSRLEPVTPEIEKQLSDNKISIRFDSLRKQSLPVELMENILIMVDSYRATHTSSETPLKFK